MDRRGRLWSTVTCISLFILGTVAVVSGLLLLVFHCLFQRPSWSSLVYCYLYFTVYFRDRRDRLWSTVTCISLFILGTIVIVSGLQLCTCISLFILGTVVVVSDLLLLVFHCLFQGPSWSSLVYCYLYFTVYFRARRGRLWSIVTCISLLILGTVVVVSGLHVTCISLFILGTVVIVSGLVLLVFHCLFYGPSWSSLVYCYLYFTVYFRDRRGRLWSTVTCISLFILETVVVVSGLLLLVFHCLFQGPS